MTLSLKESGTNDKLKGVFPFRLGTTSYIVPDDMIANVELLSGQIDDIELLAMESDEISPLPSESHINRLREIACLDDLSYSVHLPLDIDPGNANPEKRRQSVGKIVRAIDRFKRLAPSAYILHLPKDSALYDNLIPGWTEMTGKSIEEILSSTKLSPRNLCIETLDYPLSLVAGIIEEYDLSVCLDVGHLIRSGEDVMKCWTLWNQRIKVIHLHGVKKNGQDHCDISEMDASLREDIFRRMLSDKKTRRILTIEVFNKINLDKSLSTIKNMRIACQH